MCCSVLQCVAVSFGVANDDEREAFARTQVESVLQCVAVCCGVLQCVAVCCNVLQCVVVCCSVLQCVAAYVCE